MKIIRIVLIGLIVLSSISLNAQVVDDMSFKMTGSKTGEIQNQMIFSNGEDTIPLALNRNINRTIGKW